MTEPRFAAVILAAGEGTRMRSSRPKVLHELAGWPMVRHVIEALRPLDPAVTMVVVGEGTDAGLRDALEKWFDISGNWALLFGGVALIVTLFQNPEGVAGAMYRKRQLRGREL